VQVESLHRPGSRGALTAGSPVLESGFTVASRTDDRHAQGIVLAYWPMHDMGAGGWVLMSLGWVLVVGLVFWAVLSLIRSRDGDRRQANVREILDRRLADGAISVEEYERLHSAIRATPTHL
jgi:uncharacterized membrane protein